MISKRHAAFTIIELLVVVAVILLLAAILLPVLGRAKSSARSAKCTSNLKQVLNGFAFYTDANKVWPDGNYGVWAAQLSSDISTVISEPTADTVFKCPSNSSHNTDVYPATAGYGFGGVTFYCDFVVNNYVVGGAFGYDGVQTQQINYPADSVLVLDGTTRQPIYSVVYQDSCQFYTDGTSGLQRLDAPHEGRLNIGYVDNHVDRMSRDKVIDVNDHPYTSIEFQQFWDPRFVKQ